MDAAAEPTCRDETDLDRGKPTQRNFGRAEHSQLVELAAAGRQARPRDRPNSFQGSELSGNAGQNGSGPEQWVRAQLAQATRAKEGNERGAVEPDQVGAIGGHA